MKKTFLSFLLMLFFTAALFAQEDGKQRSSPIIGEISLDPELSITNFAPYTINADINPNGAEIISVTVFVTPQNGDDSQDNWDFYVDGNPDPSPNTTFSYTIDY